MVQTNVGERLFSRREYSQKQSLLIAPPSGRGARTQDHLELCHIFFYPSCLSCRIYIISHVLGTIQPRCSFSSRSINHMPFVVVEYGRLLVSPDNSASLPQQHSTGVDDEKTSKGTHPVLFSQRILPHHKRRYLHPSPVSGLFHRTVEGKKKKQGADRWVRMEK